VDDTKKPASGSGTGTFSINLTDLAEGRIYYIRTYATNSKGTVYGNEVDLDFNAVMPTLTTDAITNRSIPTNSATLNGTILTEGDPAYTERGFVYATIHNPTVEDDAKKPASGSGTGVFNANLTDLAEGNIYYIRAYATNSKGTVYGAEVELDFNVIMPKVSTQEVTGIDETVATFNGTISSLGDLAYTERGFVYATYHNPTTSDNKIVAPGSGTGTFNSNITGLTEGMVYYVRAYTNNNKGTAYGNEVSFVPDSPYYAKIATANIAVQRTDITENYVNWTNSNNLCENSTLAGYTDWRLPTLDELTIMYNNQDIVGGYRKDAGSNYGDSRYYYWSSTTCGVSCYYLLSMTTGIQHSSSIDKGYNSSIFSYYHARCVRTLQ
jgi:hypothetical protein